MYQMNTKDGYIVSVVKGVSDVEGDMTKEAFDHIMAVLPTRPQAGEGYVYRLKTDLSWVLCERPVIDETATDEA